MYDFEIIVPAETSVDYIARRLEDFKKWGLLNIEDKKIKLVLAVSRDNNVEMLKTGWKNGIDVEILHTPYTHVAQRIYYYYSEYIKPDTAKWYIRLDEDSITDIKGLSVNLEKRFDYKREYHLTGEINNDVIGIERAIIEQLGYSDWFWEESFDHEHEISITSNKAIKQILATENAVKYFKLRKEFSEGYGDHGLCFCAKMAKIYPYRTPFLTKSPDLCRLSIFGGKLNHIHYTSREAKNHSEANPAIYDWLDLTQENGLPEKFVNRKALILRENNSLFFEFGPKGALHNNSNNALEGIWGVTNEGKLTIYFKDIKYNCPLSIFEEESNNVFICKNFKLSII